MRNVTLKNTTFNAHAQNLRDPPASSAGPVRLGGEKRPSPPVISVREAPQSNVPFGRINKFSFEVLLAIAGTEQNLSSDERSSSRFK